jgi:hypothetical protein
MCIMQLRLLSETACHVLENTRDEAGTAAAQAAEIAKLEAKLAAMKDAQVAASPLARL